MKIKAETAVEKIKAIPAGQFFSVKFIKRTTGEEREMVCRKDVTKYLAGGQRAYEPDEHNLMFVWDSGTFASELRKWQAANPDATKAKIEAAKDEIGRKCFRSINLELLMTLKIDGQEYVVNELPLHTYTIRWKENGTMMERPVEARTPEEAQLVYKRETGKARMPTGWQYA